MAKKETKEKKSTSKRSKKTDAVIGEVKEFNLIDGCIVEEEIEEVLEMPKAKKLSHFDVINTLLFGKSDEVKNLSADDVKNNFFMLNRTLAIKYPMQANAFNKMTMNYKDVSSFWSLFLKTHENQNSIRQICFTKTKKPQLDPNRKSIFDYDKNDVAEYCSRYNLSLKDFKDMLYFFNEATTEDIAHYLKIHNEKEQAKNFEKIKK